LTEGPNHLQRPAERVYVIVLNWNGWRDTIECLESVFRLDYPDYKVVVCDNASSDGSVEKIRGWARGEFKVEARNPALAALTSPPCPKPISFSEIDPDATIDVNPIARMVLIQTGANLGFAGGNNVGLKYALERGDCDFVWLLNNDTVVRPDALSHLVDRMKERPEAGICGSTLLYYDDPARVQAFGGALYNKWFARCRCIGNLADAGQLPEAEEIEGRMAYVVGASMLVRGSFLKLIGLMNEAYFLYFDELDWAARAKGKFELVYCPRSIVYHREGGTIGTHRTASRRGALAEFYTSRNRILFTRTYHPSPLSREYAAVVLEADHVAAILDNPRLRARKRILRLHNNEAHYFAALSKSSKTLFHKAFYRSEAMKFKILSPAVIAKCDALWFISRHEMEEHLEKHPEHSAKSSFVPPVVEINGMRSQPLGGRKVLFIGTLSLPNNAGVVRWYVANVHPLLCDSCDYSFVVAGNTGGVRGLLHNVTRPHANIAFQENPGDTESFYEDAAVFVCGRPQHWHSQALHGIGIPSRS
jgi:GT2 family glycosyltransferase